VTIFNLLYPFQGAFVTNTSGTALVTNGCYGDPGYAIILVACLTENDLQDKTWEGFPAYSCNSTWGICTSTEDVLIQRKLSQSFSLIDAALDACKGNQWEGNFYIKTWDGPVYNTAGVHLPSFCLVTLLVAVLMRFSS